MKDFIVKRPQQKRSKAKFSALVSASARVLREHGFKGCTSAKIALEADVSIGTFYDYFSCKEAVLITYLDERLNKALVDAEQNAHKQHTTPFALLRAFVKAGVDFAFDEGDIIKTILLHFPTELQQINFDQSEQQLKAIGLSFAKLYESQVVNKDPVLIMYSLTNLLIGFQLRIALMPNNAFSRDTTTDEITEIIHNYLFKQSL